MNQEKIREYRKHIKTTIDEAVENTQKKYAEFHNKFIESRGENFPERIMSLYYDDTINIEELLYEFFDITGTEEYTYTNEDDPIIDGSDILEFITPEQQEALNTNILNREEYKGITLQEIATLIRFRKAVHDNEYHKAEAENSARWKSEEYDEPYEKVLAKELDDWGVQFDTENILEKVLENEDTLMGISNDETVYYQTVEDPSIIIAQIADRTGLSPSDINLTDSDIKELLNNQTPSNFGSGFSSREKDEHDLIDSYMADLFLDLISLKVSLGAMKPEDITHESFEYLIQAKNDLASNLVPPEGIKEILKSNNYLSHLFNNKAKSYSDQFDTLLQDFLAKYGPNISIENMDEATMQILFENNYQGTFSTPAVQNIFDRYCKEQEQNQKIAEQEGNIKQKDDTISLQSDELLKNSQTIESQASELSEKDSLISQQGEDIQNKNNTIESQSKLITEQESKIKEQQSQIEQIAREKDEANSEILRLKNELETIKTQQSQQLIALKKRTTFLEGIIEKQQRFIDSMMQKFQGVKSSIRNVMTGLKPSSFVEKIASKFTRKRDSIINNQTDEIINLAKSAEQEYQKLSMSGHASTGNTDAYVRDFVQQANEQNKENNHGFSIDDN